MPKAQSISDHATDPIPRCAGIGLRFPHHQPLLERKPPAGWVEIHSENYLSGPALKVLETIRSSYPVSMHGVGLSLGSAEGIDRRHLMRLAQLAQRIAPGLVSEHLAWSAVDHEFLADLLPLPLTQESLDVVCRNVMEAQDAFGQILIENPSTYLQFRHSTIPEPEFLSALVARTGCGLLCDLTNIVVSATNHGWDPEAYLAALPANAIGEYHLAGYTEGVGELAGMLLDTHNQPVAPAVWDLFGAALQTIGPRPTVVEWDADIPPLSTLLNEVEEVERRLVRSRGETRHDYVA